MKTLDPKFDHKAVEAGKYQQWLDDGVFTADVNSSKPAYSIVLPPPNVTGKLHLGHAWDTTLQDMLIRYKKMQGFEALWLPGMDHAGIATQSRVENLLYEQGINKHDLGREKFIEKTWEWKHEYADFIRAQWAKMGLALDYSREKFTLDSDVNETVNEVFVKLYEQGLIYQGYRITNWDPKAQTALSDIEVIHKDVEGAEHYFKYMAADGSGDYLEIMTTRPETMFGDGALAVHPEDERYAHLVGREYIIPNTGRAIPVIQDEYVSIDKGSGVVKITMAHDPNDFEVASRHKMSPIIVMEEDGTMSANEFVPTQFQGLDRFEARKAQIALAKENGLLVKVETITHSVGHSERSSAVVEPLLSKQWYVKMEDLAARSLNHQQTDDKVNFVPERFETTFNRWMENIQDWCISRQLWWGHQIPAWYKDGEVYVGTEAPEGDGWTRDEDVLDTWFSSALWPFIMVNYGKEDDISKFFPQSTLVTGYDIIFFWVSRMIFQTLHFTDQKPFEDVLIHGLIRDSEGRKMSKSLGNGVDPMDVIEAYGVDSLRFFLTTNSAPGQDLRYQTEKLESSWNFINKIWNVSRYVLTNTEDIDMSKTNIADYKELLNNSDKYIIDKLNNTITNINYNMDKYEFGEVGRTLYEFIWDDFASWYIEVSKVSLHNEDEAHQHKTKVVLKTVLTSIIKLLHPFMPFVTEEIYSQIEQVKSIVLTEWPTVIDLDATNNFETTKEVITAIRNIKAENDIKPSEVVTVELEGAEVLSDFDKLAISKLAKTNEITFISAAPTYDAFSRVLAGLVLHMNSEGLIDVEAKINDLKATVAKLDGEIMRSFKMLSNENFVSKAPEAKLNTEKDKARSYITQKAEAATLLQDYDVETNITEAETKLQELIK
ncbi:valine--tRNA ligase [Mollicutes bacterium LVI A0039]|nr:valine--tRNA ligase [Mollicutes bacterium LVI A0039]